MAGVSYKDVVEVLSQVADKITENNDGTIQTIRLDCEITEIIHGWLEKQPAGLGELYDKS